MTIFLPKKTISILSLLMASTIAVGDNDQTTIPYELTKPSLSAFTEIPAGTFAIGPNSGNNSGDGTPINANGRTGPFEGQPVQGFSAVQFSPYTYNAFLFLSDNGFGAKTNSADYLLRLYEVAPHFSAKADKPVDVTRFISLSDPYHLIPFEIVNQNTKERLLTGADFDIESFVIAKNGDIWVGDEFGPYLLHFNSKGILVQAPIATPDITNGKLDKDRLVMSPNSPDLNGMTPNLGGSRGYEGMAFSPNRKILYPMLEGTVAGDPENSLRIYKVSTRKGKFIDFVGFYPTENGHPIGDFTPVNKHQFLVIERDGGQGETALFKKIFLVDFNKIDDQGFVEKRLVVDLMNIYDPKDLNNDGNNIFTFPFVTIENVLVLDAYTILVANDNNYPFSLGRGPDIDNNEIIKISLPEPLKLDRRLLKPVRSR